jgi:hypothetical protein
MPAAAGGTRVADVPRAVVFECEIDRSELLQARPHRGHR